MRKNYAFFSECVKLTHCFCVIITKTNLNRPIINISNMDSQFCYRYPHPAVTADCVIFGFDGRSLKVLLIERGGEPYKGHWALPGGFMRIDETIEQAAERELREETNLSGIFMEQFKVYSDVDRDPRERVITVVFLALVKPEDYRLIAGDDASNAFWFEVKMLPPLAFDHRQIVREAREHLKEILRIKPVAFELLSKTFSIGELQKVYEVINDTEYDRRNFQRTVLDSNILRETGSAPVHSRAQRLYTFAEEAPEPEPGEMCCESCTACEPGSSDADEDACDQSEPGIAPGRRTEKKEGRTKGLFDFFRK